MAMSRREVKKTTASPPTSIGKCRTLPDWDMGRLIIWPKLHAESMGPLPASRNCRSRENQVPGCNDGNQQVTRIGRV